MNFGVICEFNPFHNGHKYLIDQIKGADDTVICCMSGNYVQRGEPAIYSKYQRCATALDNGADLVIELPTLCSTQSAQGFAQAGVEMLEATGVCDKLCFGAECADISRLKAVADSIIAHDSEIKQELSKGVSYPAARNNIVNSPLLESPNNILAIEYLTHTKLDCVAVERIGKGHDTDDEEYSASKIRSLLPNCKIHTLYNCQDAVLYKLRSMSAQDFAKIQDVSEGLEHRIVEAVRTGKSLDEIYEKIKTKRYTMARIRRIILRAFLDITEDMPRCPQYIHVLGFNQKGQELLNKAKRNAALPIITRYADAKGEAKKWYDMECKFTDIYNLTGNTPAECGCEQREKVIIK